MLDTLPILTPSLRLRRFALADAPKVYAMSLERGMRDWIPDQVYASLEQATDVLRFLIAQYASPDLAVKAPLVLGIARRDDDTLIGHVGLSAAPEGVEIGYAVEEAQQRRGYATEAVAAAADFGLDVLGLPAVHGIVASDNAASCTVLARAGFELTAEAIRPIHGVDRRVRTYRKARARG